MRCCASSRSIPRLACLSGGWPSRRGSHESPTAPRRLGLPEPVRVHAERSGYPREVEGARDRAVRESWLVEDRWWSAGARAAPVLGGLVTRGGQKPRPVPRPSHRQWFRQAALVIRAWLPRSDVRRVALRRIGTIRWCSRVRLAVTLAPWHDAMNRGRPRSSTSGSSRWSRWSSSAGAIAAVAAPGLGNRVTTAMQRALCTVAGEGCPTLDREPCAAAHRSHALDAHQHQLAASRRRSSPGHRAWQRWPLRHQPRRRRRRRELVDCSRARGSRGPSMRCCPHAPGGPGSRPIEPGRRRSSATAPPCAPWC